MDFTFKNVTLWGGMLQIAILCLMMVFANILRRKFPFFFVKASFQLQY